MAGKAKKKDDGGFQSKTARASMRTGGGKVATYNAAGDASRIVPLGGGTHAYLLDPRDGRTLRFAVESDAFLETLKGLVEDGHGDRIRRDLTDLAGRFPSWEPLTARLDAAMAESDGQEDQEEAAAAT